MPDRRFRGEGMAGNAIHCCRRHSEVDHRAIPGNYRGLKRRLLRNQPSEMA